ncbi:MAG: hypothetical protein HY763_12940 [Planctomycetes bacterium]|nr:hypothetical protein [Planctomycetota bacterium]
MEGALQDWFRGRLASNARAEATPRDCPAPTPNDTALLRLGPGLVDRSDRAILEVHGKDRAGWLHNLTTNQVKPLRPGDGNYAFAINAKGRILFDLVVLVRGDCVWLSLDQRFRETALAHLNKYIIMEDVTLLDRSGELTCVGLCGRRAPELLAAGETGPTTNAPLFANLDLTCCGIPLTLVRDDFCGPWAVDLIVPSSVAVDVACGLAARSAVPVSADAVEVCRVEAGIPWPGREITDEYLPAETGLLARAVSFNKGCYLGQEIVERMRARQVVARHLVGLRLEGESLPPPGASVLDAGGNTIGTATSLCASAAAGGGIALAYVRSGRHTPGTPVRIAGANGSVPASVAALPFVPCET